MSLMFIKLYQNYYGGHVFTLNWNLRLCLVPDVFLIFAFVLYVSFVLTYKGVSVEGYSAVYFTSMILSRKPKIAVESISMTENLNWQKSTSWLFTKHARSP